MPRNTDSIIKDNNNKLSDARSLSFIITTDNNKLKQFPLKQRHLRWKLCMYFHWWFILYEMMIFWCHEWSSNWWCHLKKRKAFFFSSNQTNKQIQYTLIIVKVKIFLLPIIDIDIIIIGWMNVKRKEKKKNFII